MPTEAKEHLSAKAFSKMKNLRFLKIGYVHPPQDLIGGPIQLLQGLNYLSNELRVIDWHGYPLKSMLAHFQPNKLVELRMHCSNIKQLWKGIIILNELKLIDFSDSRNLIEIPDQSGAPNLKQLILRRCTGLYKIHASIGDLKRLIRLDLNGCKCLKSLPHKISLEALEFFDLGENLGNIEGLEELDASRTAIKELPSSMAVPNVIGCLSSLTNLNLKGNNFVSLLEDIIRLSKLDSLYLSGCTNLRSLPQLPLSIDYLGAEGCTSLETLPLRPKEDFHPHLYLLNGFKLNDNQDYGGMFLTMLRRYIQRPDLGLQNILIPGSRILKWFSHQSEGPSLNLQEPPVPDYLSFGFSEQSGKIDSNHLWIKYFSMEGLWDKILSQVDANDQLSQVDVGIEIEGTGLEVTRCGARLVYEQDIEDLKQNMASSYSCSITSYEDDLDDLAKNTIIKRSHDDHDGDGDGPSGEVTYNEVDVPHPKRIRLLDLIERFIPHLGNWIGNSSTQEQGDFECEEEKSQ
nr:disease resistance protein RML1B-like [Quercus suber]